MPQEIDCSSGVDSIWHQPRSTPGLYGLLKDRLHRIAEKPVLQGTPGTPTGTLPNLERTPTFGTLDLPLVPGHIDVGPRLLRLGMQLFLLKHSA